MIVRDATEADAPALAAIYGDAVLHGFGTFEEDPPTARDMDGRRRAVQEKGLPYLVAELDGQVLGFAYAGPFRPRAAYRYTLEDSVYVSPDAKGQGVGRAVLSAVIEACEALGIRHAHGGDRRQPATPAPSAFTARSVSSRPVWAGASASSTGAGSTSSTCRRP